MLFFEKGAYRNVHTAPNLWLHHKTFNHRKWFLIFCHRLRQITTTLCRKCIFDDIHSHKYIYIYVYAVINISSVEHIIYAKLLLAKQLNTQLQNNNTENDMYESRMSARMKKGFLMTKIRP